MANFVEPEPELDQSSQKSGDGPDPVTSTAGNQVGAPSPAPTHSPTPIVETPSALTVDSPPTQSPPVGPGPLQVPAQAPGLQLPQQAARRVPHPPLQLTSTDQLQQLTRM